MLKKIVYARFHAERGPINLIEYPSDPVKNLDTATNGDSLTRGQSLIDLQQLSSFIIPLYELCNQALSISIDNRHLLGWPVSIEDERYPRNRFTFNVLFILDGELQPKQKPAWEAVVAKTARWFTEIEEDARELSCLDEAGLLDDQPEAVKSAMRIRKVIEQIFDQLTAYGACCARLSDTHVLNLRVLVEKAKIIPAVKVHAWDVPLLVASLVEDEIRTWDLVLKCVHPHINGITHVSKIASIADVELELVIGCITSLAKAEAVILLDIFHFQAIYEPTEDLTWFVEDEDMQQECSEYVTTSAEPVSLQQLVNLYTRLNRGQSIAELYLADRVGFKQVDTRRLITFGVMKGFLRRIHKYGRASKSTIQSISLSNGKAPYTQPEDAVKKFNDAWKQAAFSSGWATPPSDLPASNKAKLMKSAEELRREENAKIAGYLDSECCFDQICVELGMSESQLMLRLQDEAFSGLTIFTR